MGCVPVSTHVSLVTQAGPVDRNMFNRSTQERSQSSIREQVHGYALPTIAFGALIAILYFGRVVFVTTIISVIMALILEPFVAILARLRIPRPLATLMVGAIAALGLYFAGLAAYNQLSGLASDVPAFKDNLTGFITGVTDRIQNLENTTSRLLVPARKAEPPPPPPVTPRTRKNRKEPVPPQIALTVPGPVAVPGAIVPPIPEVRIHEDRNVIEDYIYARLGTVYEFLLMASFVPFLVYFMLSWRDHIQRSFLRFFEGSDRIAAARSLEGVAEMARAFVAGNFLIGAFLAAVSWAAFATLHIPYPFIAGLLSGFLSLVPYIGMPIAVIPPIVAALAGGEGSSVILIAFIIVLVLHLTAMNVLYPKIVGARVHLNPLVVTFSLMFWGFLWDAAGLLLAIPITAGIKAVCDNVAGLRAYGRFLGD
jgi:predicted PurR-regulated permease PerM